jgi:predicted dehydrogenase
VAVPTFLHAPIAVAALERGIHVLSEKPIARNAAEGRAMVDAARKAGRVLDVAFNHRRRGDIQALKGVIDDGGLGRPYYAKASWLRRSGIPTLGSWFTNPELAGGGPLADIGVHALDYALHLLGEPKVVAVSAATHSELGPQGRGGGKEYSALASSHAFDVEDFATAFLRLEGGGTLLIEASWATYRETDDLLDFTIPGRGPAPGVYGQRR